MRAPFYMVATRIQPLITLSRYCFAIASSLVTLLLTIACVCVPPPAGAQSPLRPTGAGDQYWQGLIGSPGINSNVHALFQAPNGDIYIGGDFTGAGGQANKIARWDGTNWQAVGGGLTNRVFAFLTLPNGDLLAGGDFLNAGGNPDADYLARWNGTQWLPMGITSSGYGINGPVRCLALDRNGDLLVAGSFENAGSSSNLNTWRIARWDGTTWQAVGTGLRGNSSGCSSSNYCGVYAMTIASNGDIIVGGAFSDGGGNPQADNIARWDGSTWQAYGSGLNNSVRTLALTATGELVVGGEFTASNGSTPTALNSIARWNGTLWSALGPGAPQNLADVRALTIARNGDIIFGSSFANAGGAPNTRCIARWNGTSIQALGTGLDNTTGPQVLALATLRNGDILVGGNFAFVGDRSLTTGRVARYRESLIPLATTSRRNSAVSSVYPNPAHEQISVSYPPGLPCIRLLDACGRLQRTVATVAGASEARVSLAGLPAGIYYVQLGTTRHKLAVH